jgi:ABC-type multidrug transport system ATPase subunit
MNAAQKRMTWELISKQKKHRTILVAMNCMNEGDTVVDKLVCLQGGEAHCSGTIRFMQQKFGGGYHLFIDKKNKDSNKAPEISLIREVICRRLGDIQTPPKESETQIDFFLPDEKTGNFRVLLEDLERQSVKLGLESFYISYRTLDEVIKDKLINYDFVLFVCLAVRKIALEQLTPNFVHLT